MNFLLPCECGAAIPVSAAAAGSDVTCQCGRRQVVPPLSQLRVMAGHGAYEAGTIDTIRRMIRNGELPSEVFCAVSGVPTNDTAIVRIQCERVWTSGSHLDRADKAIIGLLMFGWIGAIVGWARKDKPRKEHGRETYVDVPLRVTEEHRRHLNERNQTRLKALLRQVPIYDRLLNEYPEAVVSLNTSGDPARDRKAN